MNFVLILEAVAAPLTSAVTPAWLDACASACAAQLNADLSPHWGGAYAVRRGSDAADVQRGEIVFAIVDALPSAPGAVAYHDVDGNAAPVAYLALSTCSTLDDVSTAISHELCETAGDAGCNEWADDGEGSEFAHELCDAVESWSYPISGIQVSDFVLPAFFVPGSKGPLHYMATLAGSPDLPRPFTTAAGGYQIKRTSGGGESQVNGKVAPQKLAKKSHWSSRTYRRGARLA